MGFWDGWFGFRGLASPRSSVRMRMASSMLEMKTLPSPILPVLAAATMAPATSSARCVGDDHFDLDFGQQIHRVFAAAVNFGVALLPAAALGLDDGHPLDADFGQRVLHLFDAEWFDDGFYFLHVFMLFGFQLSATRLSDDSPSAFSLQHLSFSIQPLAVIIYPLALISLFVPSRMETTQQAQCQWVGKKSYNFLTTCVITI